MEPPDLRNGSDSMSLSEMLDRLLETIAWEELALAALIHAEAEKIEAVVHAGLLGPVDAEEVQQLNLAVAHVLEIVVEKEEMLRKKLNSLLALKERRLT